MSRIVLGYVLLASPGLLGCYQAHGLGSGDLSDGGTRPVDAADVVRDAGPPEPRDIVQLSEPGHFWSTLRRTLAVTDDGRLFMTDGENVYSIVRGLERFHLAGWEVDAVTSTPGVSIRSLAVDADGRLYLFDDGHQDIYVSDAEHHVSLFAHRPECFERALPQVIAVGVPGEVLALCSNHTMSRILPDSSTLLYDRERIGELAVDSHLEWIAARDDRIYYVSGFGDGDAFEAAADGSGVSVLVARADVDRFLGSFGLRASFLSIAAHPSGGAVIDADQALVRVTADRRLEWITTDPPFETIFEPSAEYPPVAVVDGSDRIYVLDPESGMIFVVVEPGICLGGC